MGTVNYGVQKHTFDYNQEATAKLFNIVNHKLTPSGIYAGFTLTKQSNTYVQVSTGICLIKDETAGVSVRIETGETQSVHVTNLTPYVVFRFEWADVQNNYMDMLSVAYEDILSTDIVVGRCVYDSAGTSMFDTFDYTRRSVQFLNKIETEKDYLRVLPTEPYSNQFLVTSGVLNSSKGNLIITGGTFPSGGIANTTNGRIDLVYVDENGTVQVVLGTDSSSPVAPRYGNRKVIAEIRRGSARNSIRGTEIFSVVSSFDAAAITSDQLITDSGSLYAATNVEDALQEIAGSAFTLKGAKIFNDLVTLLKSAIIQGVSGSNILTLKKSDGASVISVDQNGKLSTTINPELPFTDSYSKYTTDRYAEALNQIAGEAMTIGGTKTFTSSPVFPTPAAGDSSTLAATTAFVNSEIDNDRPYSDTDPLMDGTASQGSSAKVSRQDHVHPIDTSRAPTSRSISTGTGLSGGGDLSANRTLTVLYEDTGTNIKMNGTQSVGSLNTAARGDHVHPSDTSRAPVESPVFTGTPTAPTPAVTDDSTKIATTEFVRDTAPAYDLVIDSDAKLAAWAASGTYAKVLIKSGTWTLASGGVDLTARGTMLVVGEPGSKLVFSASEKGLYYTTLPTSTDYRMEGVAVECTGSSGSGYGFSNCINLSNCSGTGTGTGSGYGIGFSNCTNLSNCAGTGTGSRAGTGFSNCTNLSSCSGAGTGTGTGTGTGSGYGFSNCINLSNCSGTGTGTGSGFGFSNCSKLSSCSGTGIGNPGYGFSNGRKMQQNYPSGTSTTATYNACYASSTVNATYACADTPNGGFNS